MADRRRRPTHGAGVTGARISPLASIALAPLALFALATSLFADGALPLLIRLPWIPSLGIDLTLHIDGLALQFVLMITGIGSFVFFYAGGYMVDDPRRRRLFVLLLAFLLSMLGCVTTDNLLALFVFWELTSLTSFLLIGYDHEAEASRRSAQQALLVTGGGGLLLLVGLILVGHVGGSYSLLELMRSAPQWVGDPLVTPALLCIFAAAFTKSAQFPFHFWLPNAMSAPTPVSAYLHSATMVKLGIYLLGRLHPAFGDLVLWQVVLVSVGGATAALAMGLTLRERDLKRILAWSTVAALGTLVMLIGVPGDGAATATAAFLLAHALYKAPLFFVAGNVDHATGTRKIDHLSGLARAMPLTAGAALLAAVSMAGMPLSFGFVAKDLIAIAKTEGEVYAWVGYTSLFVSAVSVAVAGVAAIRVFWQRVGEPLSDDVHEVDFALWLPPLALATLGIVLGPLPHLVDPLIGAAAESMRPALEFEGLSFSLDDGAVVGALLLTSAIGAAIFLAWDSLHALLERLNGLDRFGSTACYERALRALPRLATASTQRLQHGSLVGYVAVLVVFVAAALLLALAAAGVPAWPALAAPSLPVAGATGVLLIAAVAVCVVRDSFVLLLASGLVGLGSGLLFIFLGAPDLAFTQFAVEVAFVVVIASILLRVRKLELSAPGAQRAWPRLLVAIPFGALVAGLLLAAASGPLDPALPQFFSEHSVSQAHGRNVVNVILVDFRAVDTLGEIAVVAVSLVAALPLVRLAREHLSRGDEDPS
jgi:multicomponent Na+:H+ antiporter subunit A